MNQQNRNAAIRGAFAGVIALALQLAVPVAGAVPIYGSMDGGDNSNGKVSGREYVEQFEVHARFEEETSIPAVAPLFSGEINDQSRVTEIQAPAAGQGAAVPTLMPAMDVVSDSRPASTGAPLESFNTTGETEDGGSSAFNGGALMDMAIPATSIFSPVLDPARGRTALVEPGSLALIGMGLFGLLLARRKV